MTSNWGFMVMVFCKGGAFVQLQTSHSLNLQCNVPLTRGTSATAEPLVCNQYQLQCI